MQRAQDVHDKLMRERQKLAIAESCTGGLLMATLSQFPGASTYLLGGVVVYANAMKEKLLHVSSKTLELAGAVSEECVIEMVQGLFKVTDADVGLAVSGIFGPSGGSEKQPIGTVWMALGKRGGRVTPHQIPLPNDCRREEYRKKVLQYLLEALWNL